VLTTLIDKLTFFKQKFIVKNKFFLRKKIMLITKGIERKPYRLCLYGPPGIGKSETANSAKNVVYINFEDALHHIDCYKTPVIKDTQNFKIALREITQGESAQSFDTIVIDTVDALEDMIANEICEDNNVKSLAMLGYGKGHDLLNKRWIEILNWIDYANNEFGKNIIFIGHDQIVRYEDPMGEGYDRISLKMHKKSAGTLISRMDAVLYMCWEKMVRTNKNNVNKAIGTGKRIIHTVENAAYVAKNRYGLPHEFHDVQRDFFSKFESAVYGEEFVIEKVEVE
jgi:hypothetical protein